MPRQIRCRCGQQLQVRHSEWTYIAAGLGIVGLLVNIVVIIYLYTRLNEVESNLGEKLANQQQAVNETLTARATAPARPPGNPAGVLNRQPASSQAPVPKLLPDKEVAAPQEKKTSSSSPAEKAPAKPQAPAPDPEAPPTIAQVSPPAPGTRQPAEKPLGKPLEEEELWKEFFRAIEDRFKSDSQGGETARSEKRPGIEPRAVFEAPALARLLFLSRSATLPILTAAHLLDPDPRLQDHAVSLLLSQPRPLLTESKRICTILNASGENVARHPRGKELLEHFQATGKEVAQDPSNTAFEDSWSTAITLAEGSKPGWPDLEAFSELLTGLNRRGLDLVLAVDTTRSMEAGLDDLKKACSWLLPALQWSGANLRVGLLTYKDKVITSHPLSEKPADDLLRPILELKALGGGDVPEGVDSAIRGTLELGRFQWRPSAARHIMVLGDAPPKHSSLPAIESLVAACHQQDGVILHMGGIHPKENPVVPFLERIAARGGGRSPTCPTRNLGEELLSVSLGTEKTVLPKDLAGLLRTVFSATP